MSNCLILNILGLGRKLVIAFIQIDRVYFANKLFVVKVQEKNVNARE